MWLWNRIRWCVTSWWNDDTNWIQNGKIIFILNNGVHSKASSRIGLVVAIEFDNAVEIVQLFVELTVSLMFSSLLALRLLQHIFLLAPVAYGRLFVLLLLVLPSRLGVGEPLLLPRHRRADRLADRRIGRRRDRWRRHRVVRRIGRNERRNGRIVRHRVERWNGRNERRKRWITRFEIDPRRTGHGRVGRRPNVGRRFGHGGNHQFRVGDRRSIGRRERPIVGDQANEMHIRVGARMAVPGRQVANIAHVNEGIYVGMNDTQSVLWFLFNREISVHCILF